MVMETQEDTRTVDLKGAGGFVIVPKGTWHTARVQAPAEMLFITAGEGPSIVRREGRSSRGREADSDP